MLLLRRCEVERLAEGLPDDGPQRLVDVSGLDRSGGEVERTFRSGTACPGTFRLLDDFHFVGQVLAFLRHPTRRALGLVADSHDARHVRKHPKAMVIRRVD